MSSRFILPNGAIALYIWGSHVTRFSALAPADTRTMPESLAGLTQELAHWSSNVDFRRKIAFHHEVVHYLQDLLTGVGYWDFLVRRNYAKKILGVARFASWLPGQSLPLKTNGVYEEHKNALCRELIMTRSDEQPRDRRQAFAMSLAAEAAEQYE